MTTRPEQHNTITTAPLWLPAISAATMMLSTYVYDTLGSLVLLGLAITVWTTSEMTSAVRWSDSFNPTATLAARRLCVLVSLAAGAFLLTSHPDGFSASVLLATVLSCALAARGSAARHTWCLHIGSGPGTWTPARTLVERVPVRLVTHAKTPQHVRGVV